MTVVVVLCIPELTVTMIVEVVEAVTTRVGTFDVLVKLSVAVEVTTTVEVPGVTSAEQAELSTVDEKVCNAAGVESVEEEDDDAGTACLASRTSCEQLQSPEGRSRFLTTVDVLVTAVTDVTVVLSVDVTVRVEDGTVVVVVETGVKIDVAVLPAIVVLTVCLVDAL